MCIFFFSYKIEFVGFPFFTREGQDIISVSTHKRTTMNCTHTNQYSESSWLAASPIAGLFIREIFTVPTLAVGRVGPSTIK
jgi:hypothetical protein